MENRWGHCCWTLPIDLICACLLTLANHWSRRPSSPCAVHGKITLLDRIPVSELQDFSGSLRRRLWWLRVRLIPRIFWFQSGYLISLSSHPRNKTRDRDEHLPLPTLEQKKKKEQKTFKDPVYICIIYSVFSKGLRKYYRVFSLTWSASMQIYWIKRKRLHKKRVQLPRDWFGTPTWPPLHCSPWRHVKTLYTERDLLCSIFRSAIGQFGF